MEFQLQKLTMDIGTLQLGFEWAEATTFSLFVNSVKVPIPERDCSVGLRSHSHFLAGKDKESDSSLYWLKWESQVPQRESECL